MCCVLCLIAQSCLKLCDPMDCSPPVSSVLEDSSGKNIGVGFHALLQGIFPTQGSNPGLAHCRHSFLPEPPGKPKNTEVGSLSLLQGIILAQESNQGLLHCRQILYHLSHQGSPWIMHFFWILSSPPSVSLASLNAPKAQGVWGNKWMLEWVDRLTN